MPLDVLAHLDADRRWAIEELLTRAEAADRRPALSDHLVIDLRAGGGDGFAAVTYHPAGGDDVLAYAQASPANDALAMEMVIDPGHRSDAGELGTLVLGALLGEVARRGGSTLTWWIHGDDGLVDLARRSGFGEQRRLYKMARSLPAERRADVVTRSFEVGRDEEAWIGVNNRAFAGHGEQGGWTIDVLRQREAEPWFDPDGFRIHERGGRLAAFCWTKIHEPTSYEATRIGEIYVIAVDPDFHGLGLGSQLTLAGLDHLAARGITIAILYVDAANEAAVRLYGRLGFAVETVSTAHQLTVTAGGKGVEPVAGDER